MLVQSAETETARLEVWYDQDTDSPREYDNLGTFITWTREYNSPDDNDWNGENGPDDFRRYWNPSTADECPFCGTANGECPLLPWSGTERSDSVCTIAPVDLDDNPYADEGSVACSWCGESWVPGPGAGVGGVLLPVYKYEHGGISYSTGAFSCPWDSGQVGFIFATAERIAESGPSAPDSAKPGTTILDYVADILSVEVDEYSKWANGECYGYTLFHRGDECPTCHHVDGDAGWVEDADGSCGGFIGDPDGEHGWAVCIEQTDHADRATIDKLVAELSYR